ncbi:MAG TPA: SDR family oxidoreductase [Puia sp.]|nr:SDR family oxidoreductase [Puia sp.]
MILVTGATGPLGKAVVEFLLKKTPGSNIAALVRDPAKAETLKGQGVDIRQGDYNNYDSLVKAFTGIDKLYFVSGNDIPNRSVQQANVVRAAKQAGIKHILYTSFQRKNETFSSPIALVAQAHLETETALKESGIPYTILKHTLYTDMLPIFIGDKVLETGVIFQPAGEGKVSYATRSDMAEAAANILTGQGHENKEYEISGNQAWSYPEIAKIISEITGKSITYVSPTQEVFKQELTKAGVPDHYIGLFGGFGEGIRQGEFDLTDPTLEKLLGRQPTSLREYLKTIYSPAAN